MRAEHKGHPGWHWAGCKVVCLRDAKAKKIGRRSGNRERRQICRLERKTERATYCYPRPSKYRRQGSVLTLLSKACSGLLDGRTRFRYVLPLRPNSDTGGSHDLRSCSHRKYDRGCVEGQQLSFVAVRADSALSPGRILESAKGDHNDQDSTHYCSNGSEHPR